MSVARRRTVPDGRWALAVSAGLLLMTGCRDSSTAPVPVGAADVTQSDVAVSAATVASGDSVSLTLETRDAQGRRLTRGGLTVTFVASGGLSRGIISPAADRGDGTYRAAFRGVIAGAATAIGATINGVPVTSPLPTVRVRPGAFSPVTSTLRVTPRTVQAGGKATLELITRDAAGNALETGGLRVSLTIGGGSAVGTVGPVTDHGNGRYSAIFTAAAVGSPLTVGATVDGTPVTAPPPTVSVARGISLEHSTITLSSDTVTVKGSVRVTFEARDSSNVRRASGGDTVRFTVRTTSGSSEGTIGTVRDHDDGTYSATFNATKAGGPVSIAASVNGRSKSSTLPSLTVLGVPLTAQQSTVSVSADTVEAGKSVMFSATLRDLHGDPVEGAASALRFTIGADGSSSGTIGPTVDNGHGAYSATFTARTAGTAVTVAAVIDDSTRIQMLDSLGNPSLPRITVRAAAASADSSLVFADPASINVGDSAVIRLVARDRFGNSVGHGGARVAFARSGGPGVSVGRIGAVRDEQDGTYTAYYRADSAGTPDAIRSLLDGQTVMTAAPTITVGPACTPGPISLIASDVTINDTTVAQRPVKSLTLSSGVTSTLTLRVRDALRCPIAGKSVVEFTTSGGSSSGIIGPTIDLADGRYTATFTGHTAGSTIEVVARVDGQTVASERVKVRVVPGDVSTRTSVLTVSRSTLAAGDSADVVLRTRDAAGNDLLQGGRSVTFLVLGNDAGGAAGATLDARDGTYRATYRALVAGKTDVIVAIIEGT
jgi:adhesin/invasin